MATQYTMYETKTEAVIGQWGQYMGEKIVRSAVYDLDRSTAHSTLASTHPRHVCIERARGVRFYHLRNGACLRVKHESAGC